MRRSGDSPYGPTSDSGALDRVRASFVPQALASRLGEGSTGKPAFVALPAIALFADLSGFTRANDLLEQRDGPRGAESITGLLESRFRVITEHVLATGGECVELNGDSVLALWSGESLAGEAAAYAALRKAGAGVEAMLADLNALETEDEIELGVRLGIGAGMAIGVALPVGGRQRKIFTGGAAIEAAITAQCRASAGGFVVADRALEDLLAAISDSSLSAPGGCASAGDADPACFAPREIAELNDPSLVGWSNVLLPGTVLFASLGAFEVASAAERERLAAATAILDSTLGPLGGRLNKVCLDDKGVTALIPFGLPPQAVYVDYDAVADAAVELRVRLAAAGTSAAIGVATGTIFSGLIGDDRRRAHCVNGRAVNRAARLAAIAGDRVLCDRATRQGLRRSARSAHVGSFALKGFAQPVATFEVRASVHEGGTPAAVSPRIIGRQREIVRIENHLRGAGGDVRIAAVEGPPGIGKSRLLGELVERAKQHGSEVIVSRAEPAMRSVPFGPWRRVLAGILSDGSTSSEAGSHTALAAVAARAEVSWELAPLLAELVGAPLVETDALRVLDGDARARVRRQLALAVLRGWGECGSALLVLEDVHWMDFASWELLAELLRSDLDIAILLSARPSAEPPSSARQAVFTFSRMCAVRLGELAAEETAALVADVLRAPAVDADVARTVHRASGGNPFYVRELALELDAGGQLARRRGRVAARVHPLLLSAEQTAGVEGVVANRIAQLPPRPRRRIKCASVAGMEFDRGLLAALGGGDDGLEEDLSVLVDAQMLEWVAPDRDRSATRLRFRHAIGRDCAYTSLPVEQRRRLNRLAAEWWEAPDRNAGDLGDALLAYHWSEAEEHARSAGYAESAGARALSAGAYADAVRLLTAAITSSGDGSADGLRRARLLQMRAAARLGDGDLGDANADAHAALALLGVRLPAADRGWSTTFLRELTRYGVCAVRAGIDLPGTDLERRRLACAAAGVVSDVAYFRAELEPLLVANLHAFAQARLLGDDEPVARALGLFGYFTGVMRLHRVAENLFRRGLTVARRSGRARRVSDCLGGIAMYHLSFGRWGVAYTMLEEAVDLCRSTTEPVNLEMGLTLWGLGKCYEGRFSESLEIFADEYRLAHARGAQQHRAWGLYASAQNLLPLGAVEEAEELLGAAREALAGIEDRHSALIATALAGLCALRQGDVERARREAAAALAIADLTMPNNFGSLAGYSALAETWIDLGTIERHETGRASPSTRRSERRALQHLARYALWFPIGRPRLAFLRGRRALGSGNVRRARRAFRAAARRSEALSMRYEQACAYLGLARCAASDVEEGRDALRRARRLLADCGAVETAVWPDVGIGEPSASTSMAERRSSA